ncbi:iron complex outermembrane receptor protein [Methylopila capsulata]|uniref:Iron complex outermembrane receptor protein n=1 Tax=Methylopila capsulata TaxID=61654 RepID=A0A9W6IV53_9HYPH|nr:TonB-dependent siderophore receptor [Methylopila capsulata]MBM7852926.1 iron complex outermembrane receptor protein [Methylopila capsulata]GLK57137.1 ligand-gated channel [Methylopila capsulata]
MSRTPFALLATASIVALTTAGAAHAQTAPAEGGTTTLEEISVEGRAAASGGASGTQGVATNDGYVAKTTRTGTKTDTPINEIPLTVNTVTQEQIEDRRPQTLEEALFYTPGVRVGASGFNPRFDSFFIRGVDITYTGVFRDGLRQYNSVNGLFRLEPYGLETISVLKGGASSIYGASASVGIIDLISKRPTEAPLAEVEAQVGSFDRFQGSFDVGGPANEEGTVLWRLTGLARHANSDLPGVPDDRVFIAPAVTFKLNDDTKITFLSEYMNSTTGGSMFNANSYDENGYSTGALKDLLYNPDFNNFNQKQGRVGYEFEHAFSDTISIHQNTRFSTLSLSEKYGGTGYTGKVIENVYSFAADTYLKSQVSTGPVEHTLLTGFDFGRLGYNSRYGLSFNSDHQVPELPDKTKQFQTMVGVYVQDEMKAGPWRLLLGGRHDWFDSNYKAPGLDQERQSEGKFTGRAGLSYVTEYGITPFVSYGTSFTPNSGTVVNSGVAKPTKGEQAEAGVKYAVPGYNASINASAFWLKQTDGLIFEVTGTDPSQLQLDFRTRGFEIEALASLENGLKLQASYSYTDTKILKLTEVTEGKDITSIPKHAFSIWSGYDFQEGALKGLGLGAGVRYTGSNFGDNLNRSVIANHPRAFVDAKASYEMENLSNRLKGVTLQVNATNLLDSIKQVCTSNYCYYNEGRKVFASLRYKW